MPKGTSTTGSELFIVDNSDEEWKVLRYRHEWCQISQVVDCATGHFEIGALLALGEGWQKVDHIRLLMGNEVTARTKTAFLQAFEKVKQKLDESIEHEEDLVTDEAEAERVLSTDDLYPLATCHVMRMLLSGVRDRQRKSGSRRKFNIGPAGGEPDSNGEASRSANGRTPAVPGGYSTVSVKEKV